MFEEFFHTMVSAFDQQSSVVLLGVVTSFVFIMTYFFYKRYKVFHLFEELGIPGPRPHFFKGNAVEMKAGSLLPVMTIEKWKQTYGKIFGYYQGPVPTIVVSDLDLIKQIAIKDFGHFSNRSTPSVRLHVAGNSLLRLEGQRWKAVRKTLTPTFSASKLKHLIPLMNRSVASFGRTLEKVVSKSEDFEIYDRFQRLTLDVIGESALAMRINCQEVDGNRLYENVKSIMQAGPRTSAIFNYFPELIRLFRFLIVRNPIFKSVEEVVENLKVAIQIRRSQSDSSKTVDMLQLMLDAAGEDRKLLANSNEEPLQDGEIIGNCFVFILAGFETTATTLAFVAYLLSIHPEVQEKVYQEIVSNVKDFSNVTYEDANKLHYLDQVINETLRLHPPVYATARVCVQDYELEGKKISKGMKVEFPIYNIHHDPDVWPDPEVFDPERFSAENKGSIHPAAHIPFGLGPRNCIGMRFALLETKLTIIKLLSKYRLVKSVLSSHPPEFYIPLITYVPKNGIFVKAEPRSYGIDLKLKS